MRKLIGLSGKAGTGKTTFAELAVQKLGGKKIALADAVKEEVSEFLGFCDVPYEQRHMWGVTQDREDTFVLPLHQWLRCITVYGDDLPMLLRRELSMTPDGLCGTYRQLLQLWGTDFRRSENPDYWVDKTAERILSLDGYVFVDDVRFVGEAEMIKRLGGTLIRIERPDRPRISNPTHQSEVDLDDYNKFDLTMLNYGSLDVYFCEILSLLRWLR